MGEEELQTSANPHLLGDETTRRIMGLVLVALLPIVVVSGVYFGWRVYGLYLLSIASAQLSEALWFKCHKRPVTFDLSCIVTGLLLTMNLPPSAPWYFPVIGSAFAIIVAKEFFGGLGYNFVNPAMAGRALLVGLFFDEMFQISWPQPPFAKISADVVTQVTPLAAMKETGRISATELWRTFIGYTGGRIGETSALLILLGMLFLLWQQVIKLHIPMIMIGVVALGAFLFAVPGQFAPLSIVVGQVLSGGLLLGAVFMATDYASSPATTFGECVFAAGIGGLIVLFRYWGATNEGVSYGILIMNCCVPLIDRLFRRRVLGEKGNRRIHIKLAVRGREK